MSCCHASLIMFVLLSKVKDCMQKTVCLLSDRLFHFCVYVNFSVVLRLGPCQLCTAVQDRGD